MKTFELKQSDAKMISPADVEAALSALINTNPEPLSRKVGGTFTRLKAAIPSFRVTKAGADNSFLRSVTIPAATLAKLLRDRVKPLKHGEHVRRDLLKQPFHGLGNIIYGTYLFTFSLLNALLVAPILALATRQGKDFWKVQGSSILGGLTSLALGVTQLVTWPLNFIFTPIRAIITRVQGAPKVEDSKGLQRLVAEFDKTNDLSTQAMLVEAMYAKAAKSLQRGQTSTLDDRLKSLVVVGNRAFQSPKIKLGVDERREKLNHDIRDHMEKNPAEYVGIFKLAMHKRQAELRTAATAQSSPEAPRTKARR